MKIAKKFAEEICTHYGLTEKTGVYDDHEIPMGDKIVTVGECRKALKLTDEEIAVAEKVIESPVPPAADPVD